MTSANSSAAQAKVVTALCIIVLACILSAGLWPFHISRNAVSWLGQENGLLFGGHGAAVSVGSFLNSRAPNETGFSLELAVTPARTYGGGTLLAFDSSPDPRAPFKLSQFGTGLAVQRYSIDVQSGDVQSSDEQGKVHQFWFRVPGVFKENQTVFVSITSGANRTDLYLNGVLAGTSTDPGIASRELTGRLVIGNSTFDDTWRGEIHGLAIYRQELTPAEVNAHFQNWILNESTALNAMSSPNSNESLLALYRFDEHAGNVVHNLVDSATDLAIPPRYFVLHHTLLNQDIYPQAPGTWSRWSSWEDLAINIFGFTPVGFVFFAYFSEVKRTRHAGLMVVLIGFLLSLTVEVSQYFLPNRDSGMADLVTNTTGTAIGVLLYRYSPLGTLWRAILQFVTFGKSYALKDSGHSSVSEENKEFTLSR